MWKRDKSEQFNAPAPQPELEAGMVYLDDNFNALRFDAWEPKDLMTTIHPVLDTARAEGEHIWDSTEHHQAYALGCWTAAARRTIAEALLVGVEESVHYKGSYPAEIAALSRSFFLDAEKWRTFAVEAAGDPDYRVSDSENLTPQAAWPLPSGARISPLLMDGLQHALGLGGAESKLVADLYPHVEQEADGPHRKRLFDRYKDKVDREQAALQRKLAFITQRWREGLDPNDEPGLTLYKDMVQCVEGFVNLGAHKLMPYTLDPDMRLVEEPKVIKRPEAELPAFDMFSMRQSLGATGLSTFDPESLRSNAAGSPTPQPAAEERRSSLPAFDPSQLVSASPEVVEEKPAASQLPVFDPKQLISGPKPEAVPSDEEEQPASQLPIFDVRQLRSDNDQE